MDAKVIKFAFIRCALVIAKFVVVTGLLCLSMLLPLAGWHRLALRVRGWWIWPAIGTLSLVALNVALTLHAEVLGWYLLAATPYCVLMVVDSWLVLPWCIEHTREQMDRYQGKEISA